MPAASSLDPVTARTATTRIGATAAVPHAPSGPASKNGGGTRRPDHQQLKSSVGPASTRRKNSMRTSTNLSAVSRIKLLSLRRSSRKPFNTLSHSLLRKTATTPARSIASGTGEMRKGLTLRFALVAASLIAATPGPVAAQTAEQPLVLKGQFSHPAAANFHLFFKQWADPVEKVSNQCGSCGGSSRCGRNKRKCISGNLVWCTPC
jgi:hypothetical protein